MVKVGEPEHEDVLVGHEHLERVDSNLGEENKTKQFTFKLSTKPQKVE